MAYWTHLWESAWLHSGLTLGACEMALSLAIINCVSPLWANTLPGAMHTRMILVASVQTLWLYLFCNKEDGAGGDHLGFPRGHQSNPGQSWFEPSLSDAWSHTEQNHFCEMPVYAPAFPHSWETGVWENYSGSVRQKKQRVGQVPEPLTITSPMSSIFSFLSPIVGK